MRPKQKHFCCMFAFVLTCGSTVHLLQGEGSSVTSPAAAASSESSGSGGEVGKTGSLKRHPCMYFLSGYCQNGLACPNYHGMDAELEELEVCVCVHVHAYMCTCV